MPTSLTRKDLTHPVASLCTAFATHQPLPTLLSHFTTSPPPLAHEHGLPLLAPFLGRDFTGIAGIEAYFRLVATHLSFEDMRFEAEDEWVVDESKRAVVVRGMARFRANSTGQSWDERFVYRLGLDFEEDDEDSEGGDLKVCEYRVWADTGAAYLAGRGELDGLR